jgi:hypothetical protein
MKRARLKAADAEVIAAEAFIAGVPKAVGKRMVSVRVVCSNMSHAPDPDNVNKSLRDGLVKCGRLVDDSAKWAKFSEPTIERGRKSIIITLNEQRARAFRKQHEQSDGKPEGTIESLATIANVLDKWLPVVLPANEEGHVKLARAMMESAASEIKAYLESKSAEATAMMKAERNEREERQRSIRREKFALAIYRVLMASSAALNSYTLDAIAKRAVAAADSLEEALSPTKPG